MVRYKVGDNVKIRNDLHHDIADVAVSMEQYRGKTSIIHGISDTGGTDFRVHYYLDIDNGKWYWTAPMFVLSKMSWKDRLK